MEVTIYNKEGKEAGKLDLSEDVFGVTASADWRSRPFGGAGYPIG